MDKAQAIHSFWSSFGLNAYDQYYIPDEAKMPYITYSVSTDSIGTPVLLTGDIWYYSESWETITKKAQAIADFIGYGYHIIKLDRGYLYITKGTPFAQRMSDEASEMVRRIHINLMCEFLTAS